MAFFEAKKAGGGEVAFDYKTWLASASLSATGYANLDAVLADEVAVRKLMTIHASVDYLASWKTTDEDIVKILSNDICAKWITLRDYALDTLDKEYRSLMESLGKYYYGEWALLSESPETWGPKGNVPIMTSDTAPYGEISYSSQYPDSNHYAYRAFDDASTGWSPASSDTAGSAYIQYEFVNPVIVKKIVLTGCYTIPNKTSINTYQLKASNDSTNWDVLGNVQLNIQSLDSVPLEIATPKAYKYIRCVLTSIGASITAGSGLKVAIYGRELKVSVPVMTSNTAPYGEAFDGGQEIAGSNPAWKVFDKAAATEANSWYRYKSGSNMCPCYIGYDFGYDVNIKYAIGYNRGDSSRTYAPKVFKIQGFVDNAWEDLTESITNTDMSQGGIFINQAINDNDIVCNKVQLYITEGNEAGEILIQELQFYGFDYSEYDWDADNPRHYLYDHGVEPNGAFTAYKTPGKSELIAEERYGSELYIYKNSATSISEFYSSVINFSNYNLMRFVSGMELIDSCAVKVVSITPPVTIDNWINNTGLIGTAWLTTTSTDMPNNNSLDVSSINGNNYTYMGMGSNGQLERAGSITEWWLE